MINSFKIISYTNESNLANIPTNTRTASAYNANTNITTPAGNNTIIKNFLIYKSPTYENSATHEGIFLLEMQYPSDWKKVENKDYFLNAEENIVTFFSRIKPFHSVRYGMYIDVDSNNETGMLAGIDYTVDFSKSGFNLDRENWSKLVQEWLTPDLGRIVEKKENYTGLLGGSPPLGPSGGYVLLSANLDKMGSPDNYKVMFYATKYLYTNQGGLETADYTNWVLMPPPKLIISTSPSPVEIRQGEEEPIQVQLKSTTGYESLSNISIRNISGIDVNSSSYAFHKTPFGTITNPFKITAFGTITIPLKIKVLQGVEVGPHTIPILINSSFPTEIYRNINTGTIGFRVPSAKVNNIYELSDLTITVQKGITPEEQFDAFWKIYGGVINLLGGGLVGGFSGWVLVRFQRNKKKNKDKKLDDWSYRENKI